VGVAGLEGEQHVAAPGDQPVVEQRGLGRLAGTLAALEAEEQAGVGVHTLTRRDHEHTLDVT
jgi:hypothetical protein